MNEPHRDPIVARALDRLPVPEHGRDFWSDLGARLDAEDGLDAGTVPLRPRRNRWFDQRNVLMAVAAALVLILGVMTLVGDGERTKVDTRATVPTDPPTTFVPTTSVPGTTAPSGARTQTRPTPDGAVLDWLEALGRGDVQTAAGLVGPKSRRYIAALGGSVEGFMTESQEGYGAWAASPDRSTTEVDLGTVDGAAATIVVVTGTWSGEGEAGFRSDAIPAVRSGSGWVVEPFAFDADSGGRLTITSPAPRSEGSEVSSLPPDGVISAAAPGSGDFYFSLDDGAPVEISGTRSGGGVTATWDPPGALSRQTHLLVAAYADGDTLTASAVRFRVS